MQRALTAWDGSNLFSVETSTSGALQLPHQYLSSMRLMSETALSPRASLRRFSRVVTNSVFPRLRSIWMYLSNSLPADQNLSGSLLQYGQQNAQACCCRGLSGKSVSCDIKIVGPTVTSACAKLPVTFSQPLQHWIVLSNCVTMLTGMNFRTDRTHLKAGLLHYSAA